MRIVAGSRRGRRLVVPSGSVTRPTTDRVREATFNALFSLDAIEDATFVDLFAGSGALGLEALSRGATAVTFVERDRAAVTALRSNIETLGFEKESTVVVTDALRWLTTAPSHDVILADPPYDFDAWPDVIAASSAGLLVIESNSPIDDHLVDQPDSPDGGWQILRHRTYGSTVVTILERLPKDHDQ